MSKLNLKDGKKREYLTKMSFVGIGVFVVIAIIVGSYFWNLIFNPDQFDVNVWANKAIYGGCIALVMMVLGFIALSESYKAKENGEYQKRIDTFQDMVDDLFKSIKLIYFDQYLTWLAARQVRNKKIKYLTKHGLPYVEAEVIVDYATERDIPVITGLKKGETPKGEIGEDVVKTVKGVEVLIPAIKDNLACYVEEVLNGTVTVEVETAAYYTSVDKNKDGQLESLERPMATERERKKSMIKSFIAKGLSLIGMVTLAALLFVDKSSGVGTGEAQQIMWFRIFAAIGGFVAGGFAGYLDGKFLFKSLGQKIRILLEYNQFFDSGEFKPVTYQESAKKRIEDYKKKQQESIAQVIDPKKENEPLQLEENCAIVPPIIEGEK